MIIVTLYSEKFTVRLSLTLYKTAVHILITCMFKEMQLEKKKMHTMRRGERRTDEFSGDLISDKRPLPRLTFLGSLSLSPAWSAFCLTGD